jgi:hypothetical protein
MADAAWGGSPANEPGGGSAPPGPARLLFRFGVGLADLARQRVNAILAPSGRGPYGEASAEQKDARRAGDAALGLLMEVAEVGQRARPALSARWAQVSAARRRLSGPLLQAYGLVRRLPGVPRRAAELRAWRVRQVRRHARWATLGRRERVESRAVAHAALVSLRETMLSRFSESPDVKRVIHEESAGIAVTAVGELRERAAHIDDLAEGAVRRLIGRGRGGGSR